LTLNQPILQARALSDLTRDEIGIAAQAEIDLAIGYPEMESPRWLTDLWMKPSLAALSKRFLDSHPDVVITPGRRLPSQHALIRTTLEAVCRLLGLPCEMAGWGFVALSGSHALERTIAACLTGRRSEFAVVTDPCIDIIPAIVNECNVNIEYVPAPSLHDCPSVESLLSAAHEGCALVVVSSPENPTGATYTTQELAHLVEQLSARDIPLLVDQSFLTVAPFDPVPSLLKVASPSGKWAVMWDTGKTFEMGDEKLGFVFASEALRPSIDRRVEVLQAALPRRTLIQITMALEAAKRSEYIFEVGERVRRNVELVEAVFKGTTVEVIRPRAGGFVLLKFCAAGESGTEVAAAILEATGVGVVGGERFFHSTRPPDTVLRVAMARHPEALREGTERIRRFLCGDRAEASAS
jgi:aspartate/methionine/tyrosine aminotransferase